MKHFIGGWALGTFVAGSFMATRLKSGQILDCYLWASLIPGPLVGLIAWGLLP